MRAKLEDILSGVIAATAQGYTVKEGDNVIHRGSGAVSDDIAKIIYNTQGLELSCEEIGFQRCFNMWWPTSCGWVVEWIERSDNQCQNSEKSR